MLESIKAKGAVDIKVYKNGVLVDRIQESNLVVTLGKTNMAKLLGGDPAGKVINKIAVGTSGATPTANDAAITNSFVKNIDSVSYPDPQSVMFNFTIGNNDANGMAILEFGLMNSDGVLCARKVRDAEVDKTNVIELVGTWLITFN